VRYGIISDVHSNLVALEVVLGELADAAVDCYLCLGDVVGYGARPNQCCDLIRELDCVCIRGNHDEAAVFPGKEEWFTPPARYCIEWTRDQLTAVNRQFLKSLQPSTLVDSKIELCHGSLPDADYYTTTPIDALLTLRVMKTSLCFFGHTHYAEWFTYDSDNELPAEHPHALGGTCEIEEGHVYLINPGAVGQPRDGVELASYAIYDEEAATVTIHRTAYDIARTSEQMAAAGLPESMYARLWLGV